MATAAASVRSPGPLRRVVASDHVAGWLFVAPSVFLIVLFGLIPVIWGFVLSLQKAGLISPNRPFTGLANYQHIASDPLARTAAVNAVYYSFLFVPLSIVLALFLAIALNQKIHLIRFYRLAVFIPVAVSTIATGIMFLWLFDKEFGLANFLFSKVGLGPFGYFDSPQGAMPALVVMTVWGWLGFDTIVFLAALQGVPAELIEAAAVDGAGRWSQFRNVVLPLLGPATLLLVVWSTISALQLFDEVYFVTKGGPLNRTFVPVFYIYRLAFTTSYGFSKAGYAAALAYVLFLVILVLTLIQFWLGNRAVHYSS
ncbi:MAG TPA: sugar ABC transporter permease [Actinomycetota bacterium]|nr:sugar ABC transporter permease [Actinomycetota bacterium]